MRPAEAAVARVDAADAVRDDLIEAIELSLANSGELTAPRAERVRRLTLRNLDDARLVVTEAAELAGDADDVAEATYNWVRAQFGAALVEAKIAARTRRELLATLEDAATNNFDELADLAARIMDPDTD